MAQHAVPAKHEEQRNARDGVRDEQRKVEQCRNDSPPAKPPALDNEGDRRSSEYPKGGGDGRRRGGEHEGSAQLDVGYEAFASLDSRRGDQLGYRRDEEEKQQRAEKTRRGSKRLIGAILSGIGIGTRITDRRIKGSEPYEDQALISLSALSEQPA